MPLPCARLRSFKPAWAQERSWKEANAPLYPYDYGLSWTSFSYLALTLSADRVAPGEALEVSVEGINTGAVAGDEVVQLYIHQRFGSVTRPVRDLKGFERFTLAPGEPRAVRVPLGPDQRSCWRAATPDRVQDETGIEVWVGGDCAAPLTDRFEVGI